VNFQQPILTAAEIARLETWAVEIAEEALGPVHDAGHDDWRVGVSRALVIHPGALFYDFGAGKGGRGSLALIEFLHNVDKDGARKIARKWLTEHAGDGRLSHESEDYDDAERAADDTQRTVEIETLWEHRRLPGGTAVELYLASRGLTAASCASIGFLPNMRGPEGAMIVAAKDPNGKIVGIQPTCKPTAASRR
jgi:hypothetical protein